MSRVAYCSKCYRIVLADEVTGFDTCPSCKIKYKFTDINQHSWYLMTAEQREQHKTRWFGSAHVANDTVRSFNEETGQEVSRNTQSTNDAPEVSTPIENSVAAFPMTKSETFQGEEIIEYLGIVTGSYVLSTTTLDKIGNARQIALEEMRKQCNKLGANAAICVSIDTQISNSLVIITASGTAVKV